MLKEFADVFPILLAGMAIGCMLMAVLQRHASRRSQDRDDAGEKRPPTKVVPISRREVSR
jgi:hypothetical protein